MAIIRKSSIQKVRVEEAFTLTISPSEAQTLLDVLGRVGGNTVSQIRDDVDSLIAALRAQGFEFRAEEVLSGFLLAQDGSD